jgi:hypothetical protein
VLPGRITPAPGGSPSRKPTASTEVIERAMRIEPTYDFCYVTENIGYSCQLPSGRDRARGQIPDFWPEAPAKTTVLLGGSPLSKSMGYAELFEHILRIVANLTAPLFGIGPRRQRRFVRINHGQRLFRVLSRQILLSIVQVCIG